MTGERPVDRGGRLARLFAIALLLPGAALAAEYFYEPRASFHAQVNDNPLLTQEKDTVYGGFTDLQLEFGAATERSSLSLTPRGRIYRFASDDRLDREDLILDLAGRHLFTERLSSGLAFNFTQDTTTTSEAEDTGLVRVRTNRTSKNVSPSLSYALTDRDTLSASFSWTDVAYEETVTRAFTDYEYLNLSGVWQRQFSETSVLFATLFVSRFKTPQTEGETDSIGFQAGFERAFTETLSGRVAVGAIHSEFEFLERIIIPPFIFVRPAESDDTGVLLDFSLTKRFEVSSVTVSYVSSVSPSGRGAQQSQDRWKLLGNYRINERLTALLDVEYLVSESQSAGVGSPALDRTYWRAEPRLRWRWTENWSVVGAYRYVNQEYDTAPDAADSNAVTVSLVWAGDRSSISR